MNLKKLQEERAEARKEMNNMVDSADKEERAMTPEELDKFNELAGKVDAISKTIEAEEKNREEQNKQKKEDKPKEENITENKDEERAELEERAFASFLRGEVIEERAEANLTITDGKALIPTSIAQKIIKKVKDICPIYEKAEKFNVKGRVEIPYYDTEETSIKMAYANEFEELESSSGKFKNIELSGFLAGALTKVSKSLANNSQFDIVSFVIKEMADVIAQFIENEAINGTVGKAEGLKAGVKLEVVAEAASAITADEIILLKDKIKDAFQNEAMFIMNSETRTAIRLLKDNNGRYLLQDDLNSSFGSVMLGKDVYTTDSLPKISEAAGAPVIYYGDFSGLAIKMSEEAEIEVLREKFSTQHALGVIGWIEIDAKVQDAQRIAKLTMKTA